jgi:hypothetical protein
MLPISRNFTHPCVSSFRIRLKPSLIVHRRFCPSHNTSACYILNCASDLANGFQNSSSHRVHVSARSTSSLWLIPDNCNTVQNPTDPQPVEDVAVFVVHWLPAWLNDADYSKTLTHLRNASNKSTQLLVTAMLPSSTYSPTPASINPEIPKNLLIGPGGLSINLAHNVLEDGSYLWDIAVS